MSAFPVEGRRSIDGDDTGESQPFISSATSNPAASATSSTTAVGLASATSSQDAIKFPICKMTALSESGLQRLQCSNATVEISPFPAVNSSTSPGASSVECKLKRPWEQAGVGSVMVIKNLKLSHTLEVRPSAGLGPLRATSIAGNDLLSSILYTAGISIFYAGKYAPVGITLVCVTLYHFQKIYAEVGSALPFNGGSYNVMLNTTSKLPAAVVACLSVLSYLATALVSASSAAHYLADFPVVDLSVYWVVMGLFTTFCLLSLLGIKESSVVATAIFGFHIIILALLLLSSMVHLVLVTGGTVLWANVVEGGEGSGFGGAVGQALYLSFRGYASALLGITGFETSCNYIEEQNAGVFPKTLRNMWRLVVVFNPALCLLCLANVPLPTCIQARDQLLSKLAQVVGGDALRKLVVLDGFLVLCGSVLTSFVGVTGLLERLSVDRVLPQFLMRRNPYRHTCHYIILGFFALCTSLWTLSQDMTVLAGIYGASFLLVMTFVVVANMLLRYNRPDLPRSPKATWASMLFALTMVLLGFFGTLSLQPGILAYFTWCFVAVLSVMVVMFFRVRLLNIAYYFVLNSPALRRRYEHWIQRKVQEFNEQPVVVFLRSPSLYLLNKAVLYCLQNEQTDCIYVVHCMGPTPDGGLSHIGEGFQRNVHTVGQQYPKVRLHCVLVEGVGFTPEVVSSLAEAFGVARNFMFMGCPKEEGDLSSPAGLLREFGGVRLITH